MWEKARVGTKKFPPLKNSEVRGAMMRNVFEWLLNVLLVVVVICAIFVFVAPHLGWRVDAVLSGSMEPTLKVGSVEITKPFDPNNIQVGDIITFRSPRNPQLVVSHRVVAITDQGFITKGDANRDNDQLVVPPQNVVGKVVLHVPYVGYVIWALRTPLGFILALVVPATWLVILEIMNIRRELAQQPRRGSTNLPKERNQF